MSTRVWFLFVDAHRGKPYKNTTATTVKIPCDCLIDQFRDVVHADYYRFLGEIPSAALWIYKNKAAFDKRNDENDKQYPLDGKLSIEGLGTSFEEALVVAVYDVPEFDPSTFRHSFPFFEQNDCDDAIEIVGREEIINQINSLARSRTDMEKYSPIIISTGRGMGKTFLLKKVGSQHLGDDLKCSIIGKALEYGRILSFDFKKWPDAIENEKDVYMFFPRLMIFYLCKMFAGTQVSGIHFEEISHFPGKKEFIGKQYNFNNWLQRFLQSDTYFMIREYIRLTNEAFKTQCDIPPVFLLDEIQILLEPTKVESKFGREPILHIQLSLLLCQLARGYKPLCICTGTDIGGVDSILDRGLVVPRIFSLSTIVKEADYLKYWNQLTDFRNQAESCNLVMENDYELISALVFASYQIPRLLFLAHETWFRLRLSNTVGDLALFRQTFESFAISHYPEMAEIMKLYDVDTIAHVLLHCGVHIKLDWVEANVPATNTTWSELIAKSLIFPHLDDCYIFPFTLIWNTLDDFHKNEIETRCSQLVGNLDIKALYLSFDTVSSWDLYSLEVGFETLFASSMAVKYFLKLERNFGPYVPFLSIYDISWQEEATMDLLEYQVDLSRGIFLPETQVHIMCNDVPKAVVYNQKIRNAHHEIIIPAIHRKNDLNIAVSFDASFDSSKNKTIESHLLVSPNSTDTVERLIWVYIDKEIRKQDYPNVAFLDGSGCCNGFALDLLIFMKKLWMKTSKRKFEDIGNQ